MDQETEEGQELELQQAQAELAKLRSLVKSAGWALLLEIANEQVERRKNKVLFEPVENGEVLKQEFMKGELCGIALFMQLPQHRIDDLKDTVESLTEETQDATDE